MVHRAASGRVSISSCGSMPAVGLPVMLRMLSAPAPRVVMPSSCRPHQHVGGVARRRSRGSAGWRAWSRRRSRRRSRSAIAASPRDLVRVEDAAGEPQPAHERVLRRRDVEQPVELEEEDVGPLREAAGSAAVADDLVPTVERVLLALGLLLGDQLAAGRDVRSCAARCGSPGLGGSARGGLDRGQRGRRRSGAPPRRP